MIIVSCVTLHQLMGLFMTAFATQMTLFWNPQLQMHTVQKFYHEKTTIYTIGSPTILCNYTNVWSNLLNWRKKEFLEFLDGLSKNGPKMYKFNIVIKPYYFSW